MKNKFFQKSLALWAKTHPKQAVLLPYIDSAELCIKDTPAECKKLFLSLETKHFQVLYVYGVGLGHFYEVAKPWLKKLRRHQLIFLEDDLRVIEKLFKTERGLNILQDPQVHLFFFKHLEDLSQAYWFAPQEKIHAIFLPFYAKTKQQRCEEVHHQIAHDASKHNSIIFEYLSGGIDFFHNFYPNMLGLEGGYLGNALFGKFSQIPAIICGAGPSLSQHFPLLKKLKNKALIFAGGSALNAITKAGVIPHFGAGIDPNPEQEKRLKATQEKYPVPFLYRNRLYHPAFQLIKGPRLYITGSGGYEVSDWFEQQLNITGECIDEGHNVVNFCLNLAHAFGCNPIIFVGLDLAYTNQQSYAPGVVSHAHIKDYDSQALLRTDIYGKPIYTLWKWITEAEWVSQFAKDHPELVLINATEGGLGLPGIPNQPLAEVSHTYLTKTYPLQEKLHRTIQKSLLKQVTQQKIVNAMQEFLSSAKRCLEFLNILIEEETKIAQGIKSEKKVPLTLHTGIAALNQLELSQEPFCQYVLELFHIVYSKLLNKKLLRPRTAWQTQLKRKELNIQCLTFLRNVTEINISIIEKTLKNSTFLNEPAQVPPWGNYPEVKTPL